MGREFVNEQRQQLPPDTYDTELLPVEEIAPYDGPSRYERKGEPENRLCWPFRVLKGPQAGKLLEQITGLRPEGPRSNNTKLLTMLLGRPLGKNERVYEDNFVGKHYRVVWSLNPESEAGRCHISSITPLPMAGATPNGDAAQPAQGPPPPPDDAAGVAGTPAQVSETFWIVLKAGEKPVVRDRAAIEVHMKEHSISPQALKVCLLGKQEWVAAATFNFPDPVTF
jgi:hypothetical protein